MSENFGIGGKSIGRTKRKRLIETLKSAQSVLVHCVAVWVRHDGRNKGVRAHLAVRLVPRVNLLSSFLLPPTRSGFAD